jgi:hypothetical protein
MRVILDRLLNLRIAHRNPGPRRRSHQHPSAYVLIKHFAAQSIRGLPGKLAELQREKSIELAQAYLLAVYRGNRGRVGRAAPASRKRCRRAYQQ